MATAKAEDQAAPQPRERAVPCRYCDRDTWNVSAVCDACAGREDRFSFTAAELRVIERALGLSEMFSRELRGTDAYASTLLRRRVKAMLAKAGEAAA